MNKLLKISVIALATLIPSLSAFASSHASQDFYVYGGLSNSSIELKHAEIDGLTKNIGLGMVISDFSIEVGYKHLNESYNEINFAAMYDFYKRDDFSVYGKLDLGIGDLKLSNYRNGNEISRFGFGAGVKYDYTSNISVTVEVLSNHYSDSTPVTTCNDNTFSSSTGRGTCSGHNGVSHRSDIAGDGNGTEFGLSVRYLF